MSKGLVYKDHTDPQLSASLKAAWERRAAKSGRPVAEIATPFIEDHNARWAIVGSCARCGRDLVRGEGLPHLMTHVSDHARPVARLLAELSLQERQELLALFDMAGHFIEAPDA